MSKKATYRKTISKNGLFALSLVFSLFAFPGFVNTAEACRLEPQRVEFLADEQDVAETSVIPYQITESEFSENTLRTTKEYEYYVQLVYQRHVKETLNTILKQSYTYSLPNLFWIVRVTSSLRNDASPLT